jgi:hypothetical protein
MNYFVRTTQYINDLPEEVEVELTEQEANYYKKLGVGMKILIEPTGDVPLILKVNSTYKMPPMDFGDDPVVVSL